MLDIETLGTSADSVILSIGAVIFDTGGIEGDFYTVVDPVSCLEKGLKIDERTMEWWAEQSEDAQAVFGAVGMRLEDALLLLAKRFDWSNTLVWCDNSVPGLQTLDTAYNACGMPVPWAYYNTRDYHTLKMMYDDVTRRQCLVDPEVQHHALHDAIAQTVSLLALQASGTPLAAAA